MSTASATPALRTPLWMTATCGENYEVWQNCVAEAGGGSRMVARLTSAC
jgi:hypothetical protein